jgi:hypothetical protein
MGIGGESGAKDASNEKPLHGTDALFDPPPHSLPQHHHYVGPLWWEPSSEAPTYLNDPGTPYVLVTAQLDRACGVVSLRCPFESGRPRRKQHLTTSPPLSNKFGAPSLQRGSGGGPSADR